LGIDGVGAIQHKSRKVSNIVNPVRVCIEIAIVIVVLKLVQGTGLEGLAVKNNLFHSLVFSAILYERREGFICLLSASLSVFTSIGALG
jgi:hypothetical protein